MKNKYLRFAASVAIIVVLVFLAATINVMSMPGNMEITDNSISQVSLNNKSWKSNFIYKIDSSSKNSSKENSANPDKLDINIKLFGVIPVKKVTLNIIPETRVIPGGQPIGVKISMDGILVVGFSDIDTKSGRKQSPAAVGGVEIGDRILEVNDCRINNCSELSDIINKNGDKTLKLKLCKNNENRIVNIKPVETNNLNEYKIGLWVRDSTAGVGTLTFYDPSTRIFGALGHPISDVDTGILLPIKDGKIYNAKIISVEQGVKGKPGELRGTFSGEDEIGILEKNTPAGIYGRITGKCEKNIYNKPIPIATQNEVKEGPAKILTSIDGSEVKEYSIYIEKVTQQTKPNSKSMIIRVTDSELLAKTGGIVQGMSGSPIIQDGKLAGAVTHVFVNRPDMGYGVYIEWMIKESGLKP